MSSQATHSLVTNRGITFGDEQGMTLKQVREFVRATSAYPEETVVNAAVNSGKKLLHLRV